MKKTQRKLIPAVAMLLISAIMLSTSSFAWFSMNSTVTATGMTVRATTSSNLFIANGIQAAAASVNDTAITLAFKGSLKPTEITNVGGTLTVKNATGYSAAPTPGTAGTASGYENIGTITAETSDFATVKDYVACETMTLCRKSNAEGKCNIDAKVEMSLGENKNINKAIRCGMLVGTTWVEASDKNTASGKITWEFKTEGEGSAPLISGLADNAVQAVTFMVWYEGEDTDCFFNNAQGIAADNSVVITFTSTDA